MPKGIVKFTVDNLDFWEEYAEAKGFKNVSALAYTALRQYESRHSGHKGPSRYSSVLDTNSQGRNQ